MITSQCALWFLSVATLLLGASVAGADTAGNRFADLPRAFTCEGTHQRDDFHVTGRLADDMSHYDVRIEASADGPDTGLRQPMDTEALAFTIEVFGSQTLVLLNLNGRRTTTLEIDFTPSHPSFVDDGTTFFFEELRCTIRSDVGHPSGG